MFSGLRKYLSTPTSSIPADPCRKGSAMFIHDTAFVSSNGRVYASAKVLRQLNPVAKSDHPSACALFIFIAFLLDPSEIRAHLIRKA